MNFSFYVSGMPNGYNNYPADRNSVLLQKFAQESTTQSQLTVYRKGQLVYYAYLRNLQEKSNNYLGFCLIFNGIYCQSPKKLYDLFDKAFYDVQLKGELLKFEKGKCSFIIDKFTEKPTEITRIETFFKYEIENNFSQLFSVIPVSFKIDNGKKTISIKEDEIDILSAIAEFDVVHISNNEKSVSELEQTHKLLTKLYAEKQVLDYKYNKIRAQKKQYKVVLFLCLIVFGCVIGLFAFNRNLQSKDNRISNLNKEITQKQTNIENLNANIAKLQVEQKNLANRNLRLTNEASKLSTSNKELMALNDQQNSEIIEKNYSIRILESKNNSYRYLNNNLQSKNQSLLSDVEAYKKYVPQTYKVISDADFYYKYKCNQSYEKTNCYTSSENFVSVYATANGYGLTEYGWVKLNKLSK